MKLLNKYHTPEYWKGAGFPITKTGKGTTIQEEVTLIKSALIQLFNTKPGERVMLPTFGSQLHKILFDPNDVFLQQDISYYIRDAINRWEPRVAVKAIVINDSSFNKNNNTVEISLEVYLRNNPSATQILSIPISTA